MTLYTSTTYRCRKKHLLRCTTSPYTRKSWRHQGLGCRYMMYPGIDYVGPGMECTISPTHGSTRVWTTETRDVWDSSQDDHVFTINTCGMHAVQNRYTHTYSSVFSSHNIFKLYCVTLRSSVPCAEVFTGPGQHDNHKKLRWEREGESRTSTPTPVSKVSLTDLP